MSEMMVRFMVGGTVVSIFATLSDIFRPKSFAGLFGAAPSIALATFTLTIRHYGGGYAALEARSMILGAVAFLVYSTTVSRVLMRRKLPALKTTLALMPLWFAASSGLLFILEVLT
jgi:Protein of unknown function (DUF3147)